MPNLSWLRIPADLRSRRQWAVSTLAPLMNADGSPVIDPRTGKQKVDKSPRSPHSGYNIDLTNASAFASFEECVNSGYPAIGYILTADDPFTIIDLDQTDDPTITERHRKIFGAFHTYAETSQSGLGAHLILNGTIGGGVRRDQVEVYDQERYMICTGNILRDAPISQGGETLARLVYEMGGVNASHDDMPESQPERMDDATLLDTAANARNGERFKDLYYRVPVPGEDWSHRDASLAQILAFYSRNHDQLLRLFRQSALYRPHDKGKNPAHYEGYYLARTFARAIRAEMARDVDLEAGRKLVTNMIQQNATQTASPSTGLDYPAGLVGDIARFIFDFAPRPVKEIAIAGALAFMAGLVGRHYNIGGTGLNLYVVMLAETGRGKEAAPDGIEAIVTAVRQTMPTIDQFMGPGQIASGQALTRALDKSPSFFSPLGEFGHLLRRVTDARASQADVVLRQMLLALFSKSGKGKMLRGTAYSDVEKNTKDVMSPAFSFLGDTTPEAYYGCFTSGLVSEGLIPRFLSITYDGPRVPMNESRLTVPPQALVDRITAIVSSVLNMMQSNSYAEVTATLTTQEMDRQFNAYCDSKINESGANAIAEVWNRAHLKARRIAAILAVGRNHLAPVIQDEDYDWAVKLVKADIETLTHRIKSGDVGTGDTRRHPEVEKAIKAYAVMTPDQRRKYDTPQCIADKGHIIPFVYFNKKFRQHPAFSNHPRGLNQAVKDALQEAIDVGILQEVGNEQKMQLGRIRATTKLYALSTND